jgi:hypothetical protein
VLGQVGEGIHGDREGTCAVAASERRESRARPQTPWPLVQPLPRRVPNPTGRPATISRAGAAKRPDLGPKGDTQFHDAIDGYHIIMQTFK